MIKHYHKCGKHTYIFVFPYVHVRLYDCKLCKWDWRQWVKSAKSKKNICNIDNRNMTDATKGNNFFLLVKNYRKFVLNRHQIFHISNVAEDGSKREKIIFVLSPKINRKQKSNRNVLMFSCVHKWNWKIHFVMCLKIIFLIII